MKFHLSPEQDALQDTIARTIGRVCSPRRRREFLDSGSDHDGTLWRALMDAGLGGLLIPEKWGGTGLGLETAALALEVVGKAGAPGPYLGHLLAGWAVAQSENEDLQSDWLPKLATGEVIGAIALDGWLPSPSRLSMSDGRLNGEIRLVPGAGLADVLVVGTPERLAFLTRGRGVTTTPVEGSDLTRRCWHLALDATPAAIVENGDTAARLFDAALVLIAADALGGAEQCLEMSVSHALQRKQFGQLIGQFQAIKHQLANMALDVEPARALVWYAAYAWDLGLPDARRAAAHAKAHLTDRFVSVSRAAVQIHGGIGYTWEHDLHLWFRRALFDCAYLGTPSIHWQRVAEIAGWAMAKA